jgi:hypothetical protein
MTKNKAHHHMLYPTRPSCIYLAVAVCALSSCGQTSAPTVYVSRGAQMCAVNDVDLPCADVPGHLKDDLNVPISSPFLVMGKPGSKSSDADQDAVLTRVREAGYTQANRIVAAIIE